MAPFMSEAPRPKILALRDLAGKRIEAPAVHIARRHHVGMAGEDEVRRAVADPGEEIVDIGRAGLVEDFALRKQSPPH